MTNQIKSLLLNDVNLEYKPVIFDFNNDSDFNRAQELIDSKKIDQIIDTYSDQEKELLEVNNPSIISQGLVYGVLKGTKETKLNEGVWVYFPWKKCLVHTLKMKDYYRLRVSRNAYLISDEEQKKFANCKIGFAGLNVGNPGAICVAQEGGSRFVKFADFDSLSLSNMNRFRASISELGLNKVLISARQAYEIDPFLDIDIYDKGITSDNIDDFLLKPKIDVLVEEMDNLKLKLIIREKARQYKIPVVMVTAHGIIDIERYDLDQNIPILNGELKSDVIDGINKMQPGIGTIKDKVYLARDFIGKSFLSDRLYKSFDLVGDKMPSIPQLAEWTFIRGAVLSYFSRMIVTGKDVPSGRYIFNNETLLK